MPINKSGRKASKPSTKSKRAKKKPTPRRRSSPENKEQIAREQKFHKMRTAYLKALNTKIPQKKIGRPTKYLGELTCELVEDLANVITYRNFFSYCSVEHVAEILSVSRDTIYEWTTKYPEFSKIMDRWEQKRNSVFYEFVVDRDMKPGVWIFLAKNWLGMKDEQITSLLAKEERVQYISHIPDPQKPGSNPKPKGKKKKPRRKVERKK